MSSNTTMRVSSFQVFVSAAVLAVALADNAPYRPPPPAYHEPEYPAAAPVYNYEYGVNDPKYGAVYSATENRDNYNTAGEYRVNLPDGRVQIVSYTAGPDGYVADVRYEGEAHYPEEHAYKPAYKPAPSYKPAPAYKPAPKPAYKPEPAPYKPAPKPTYKPEPAPYKPAPAYKPAPTYVDPYANTPANYQVRNQQQTIN